MAEQFCSYQLKGIELITHFHWSTVLALCVLNFIFSPVAALGNALSIQALWKASSVPANIKKLFLSLAISDLAVGLFAQLIDAGMLGLAASDEYDSNLLCPTFLTVCFFSSFFLACVSFLTVTAIAVDRLLAISLHLRYKEFVTPKRIITALLLTWFTSGVTAFVFVYIHNRSNVVLVLIQFVGFVLTTVAYVRIYKVVMHHQNQIHGQFREQNAEAVERLRDKKSTLNVIYFYVVFVACYFPSFCAALMLMTDDSRISFWEAYHVGIFCVLLNSSLNPLVYCWRYQEIRQIMKSTVSKLFRLTET